MAWCVLQHLWPDLEEKLSSALLTLEMELRKAAEIAGLTHIAQALEEVGDTKQSDDAPCCHCSVGVGSDLVPGCISACLDNVRVGSNLDTMGSSWFTDLIKNIEVCVCAKDL